MAEPREPVEPSRPDFGRRELAIVCSHYELGTINSMHEFSRGSPRSPKILIKADRGVFLLKRRAPDRSDPYRVALCHRLQLHLANEGFPTPQLVGTRADNNSMLQHDGRVYELFRYVDGRACDRSTRDTQGAGAVLARLHRLASHLRADKHTPRGTYHDSDQVRRTLAQSREQVRQTPAVLKAIDELGRAYEDAADRASALLDAGASTQLVHGDFHPGNVLYRDGRVAAVLDFDSARTAPVVVDLASAALHFALEHRHAGQSPTTLRLDAGRLGAFVGSYSQESGGAIAVDLTPIPLLMTEALIAEAVDPVARTGRFGGLDGGAFLRLVATRAQRLGEEARIVLEGSPH